MVEDVRVLKRDFNTFSKWSEAYQQKIDRHYKEIEDLNINSMTPIEALKFLNKLKNEIKK